jgi:hypothetical protein
MKWKISSFLLAGLFVVGSMTSTLFACDPDSPIISGVKINYKTVKYGYVDDGRKSVVTGVENYISNTRQIRMSFDSAYDKCNRKSGAIWVGVYFCNAMENDCSNASNWLEAFYINHSGEYSLNQNFNVRCDSPGYCNYDFVMEVKDYASSESSGSLSVSGGSLGKIYTISNTNCGGTLTLEPCDINKSEISKYGFNYDLLDIIHNETLGKQAFIVAGNILVPGEQVYSIFRPEHIEQGFHSTVFPIELADRGITSEFSCGTTITPSPAQTDVGLQKCYLDEDFHVFYPVLKYKYGVYNFTRIYTVSSTTGTKSFSSSFATYIGGIDRIVLATPYQNNTYFYFTSNQTTSNENTYLGVKTEDGNYFELKKTQNIIGNFVLPTFTKTENSVTSTETESIKCFNVTITYLGPNPVSNLQIPIYSLSKYLDNNNTLVSVMNSKDEELPFCYDQGNVECSVNISDNIWVKIPYLTPGQNYTITICQSDKNYATSGDEVFDFYDDFNEDTVDTTKWKALCNAGISVENGFLEVLNPDWGPAGAYSSKNVSKDEVVEIAYIPTTEYTFLGLRPTDCNYYKGELIAFGLKSGVNEISIHLDGIILKKTLPSPLTDKEEVGKIERYPDSINIMGVTVTKDEVYYDSPAIWDEVSNASWPIVIGNWYGLSSPTQATLVDAVRVRKSYAYYPFKYSSITPFIKQITLTNDTTTTGLISSSTPDPHDVPVVTNYSFIYQTFNNPTISGKYIHADGDSAMEFCREKGYDYVSDWSATSSITSTTLQVMFKDGSWIQPSKDYPVYTMLKCGKINYNYSYYPVYADNPSIAYGYNHLQTYGQQEMIINITPEDNPDDFWNYLATNIVIQKFNVEDIERQDNSLIIKGIPEDKEGNFAFNITNPQVQKVFRFKVETYPTAEPQWKDEFEVILFAGKEINYLGQKVLIVEEPDGVWIMPTSEKAYINGKIIYKLDPQKLPGLFAVEWLSPVLKVVSPTNPDAPDNFIPGDTVEVSSTIVMEFGKQGQPINITLEAYTPTGVIYNTTKTFYLYTGENPINFTFTLPEKDSSGKPILGMPIFIKVKATIDGKQVLPALDGVIQTETPILKVKEIIPEKQFVKVHDVEKVNYILSNFLRRLSFDNIEATVTLYTKDGSLVERKSQIISNIQPGDNEYSVEFTIPEKDQEGHLLLGKELCIDVATVSNIKGASYADKKTKCGIFVINDINAGTGSNPLYLMPRDEFKDYIKKKYSDDYNAYIRELMNYDDFYIARLLQTGNIGNLTVVIKASSIPSDLGTYPNVKIIGNTIYITIKDGDIMYGTKVLNDIRQKLLYYNIKFDEDILYNTIKKEKEVYELF